MRIGVASGFAAALLFLPAAAQEVMPLRTASRSPTGCSQELRRDRLEAVTPEGELLLGSERLAKLSGIRLPDELTHRQMALDWLRSWSSQSVLMTIQGNRDRWGRLPIRARILKGSSPVDLSHGLVEAGLAIADPGAAPAFCQPELLAIEETARERRLGLWAEARYNPIPVDQSARLQERAGSFVIVEGQVRSIGEGKQRTYLNFGEHWAEDFTIIIPKKTWTMMAARGISAASLKGRTIRARGILQSWQGTALTIDLPDMIERLEGIGLPGRNHEDTRLAR